MPSISLLSDFESLPPKLAFFYYCPNAGGAVPKTKCIPLAATTRLHSYLHLLLLPRELDQDSYSKNMKMVHEKYAHITF